MMILLLNNSYSMGHLLLLLLDVHVHLLMAVFLVHRSFS